MNTSINEYEPNEHLLPFIEHYWEGNFNANASGKIALQMLPNGCLDIIFHLNDLHCDLANNKIWCQSPDFMILGMYTKPYEVRFQSHVHVFAIRFKPEGIYNILGVPASVLIDSYHDTSLVLGSHFQDFSNRLKEEKSTSLMIEQANNYLLKSLRDNNHDLSYVNVAAGIIRNSSELTIKEIAERVSISQRQLERSFKNQVGISPKHYLRITRINEVVRVINNHHELDLTKVAYHCGYFDQAHFIHDFKKLTGNKPSIFKKENGSFISNPYLEQPNA